MCAMRRVGYIVAAAALAGATAVAGAQPEGPAREVQSRMAAAVLTAQGLGYVGLGMGIGEAEEKLGAKLGRPSRSAAGFAEDGEAVEACEYWRRWDGLDPGIAYMVEGGEITRIDVFEATGAPMPNVKLATGIEIGSSLADLEKAYGTRLELEAHPLESETRWGIVERAGASAVRVEVIDGAVRAIFAARGPALSYSEGCS